MSPRSLFLVRMDVAHDHEPAFNEVYDTEHIPLLSKVPGVARATRYRNPSPTDPRYIAAYEIEWCGARNGGRRTSRSTGPSSAIEAMIVAIRAALSSRDGRRAGIGRARRPAGSGARSPLATNAPFHSQGSFL